MNPNEEVYLRTTEASRDSLVVKLERYRKHGLIQLAVPRDVQGELYPSLQGSSSPCQVVIASAEEEGSYYMKFLLGVMTNILCPSVPLRLSG